MAAPIQNADKKAVAAVFQIPGTKLYEICRNTIDNKNVNLNRKFTSEQVTWLRNHLKRERGYITENHWRGILRELDRQTKSPG